MITVLLRPIEIRLAINLGNQRCGAKPESIRGNQTWNAVDDRAAPHRIGAAGEIAVARLLKKPVDQRVLSGGDLEDFGGIEVKSSTYTGPGIELKVPFKDYLRKRPDVYILCRVHPSLKRVDVLGGITREKFDQVKVRKSYGYLDNWVVGVDQLDPLDLLPVS